MKVCVVSGKKKSWYPAYVTKYSMGSNGSHRLSLSYEDADEKEHVLDSHEDYAKFQEGQDSSVEEGLEGTLDGKKIKFRVTAVPQNGGDKTFSFGDSAHDDDVEDGLAFPAVPPSAGEGRLPRLVHDKSSVRLWHLQDRKFKRPIADLRVRVQCDGMAGSALNQACMALFCKLCADALVETCYLASVSEIGSTLRATETGFYVRVNGFDHKLLELAKQVLSVVFSFKGRNGQTDLPSTIKSGRFEACLEVQLRQYRNAGLDASSFSSSLRLMCLRPAAKSSFAKLRALEGITVAKFVEVMNALLGRLSVEALYHGNVTQEDAGEAAATIVDSLTPHHVGLPKKRLPSKLVVKVRHSPDASALTVPSIDPKDSNTAVEVYFQFAKDDNSEEALRQRVLTDLLEALLDEPLYDQLRTKEQVRGGMGMALHFTEGYLFTQNCSTFSLQFGYEVSCGSRWTFGVLGMSFRVVTSCKSAEETSGRIDEFLASFRSDLESMEEDAFLAQLVSLAQNKLEAFDSLEDECGSYWSEIIEGRYDWEAYRKEVLCLRQIRKKDVLDAYDEWLNPVCAKGRKKKRRKICVHVIGSGEGEASAGRPDFGPDKVGDRIDDVVAEFHNSTKETWGKIVHK